MYSVKAPTDRELMDIAVEFRKCTELGLYKFHTDFDWRSVCHVLQAMKSLGYQLLEIHVFQLSDLGRFERMTSFMNSCFTSGCLFKVYKKPRGVNVFGELGFFRREQFTGELGLWSSFVRSNIPTLASSEIIFCANYANVVDGFYAEFWRENQHSDPDAVESNLSVDSGITAIRAGVLEACDAVLENQASAPSSQ